MVAEGKRPIAARGGGRVNSQQRREWLRGLQRLDKVVAHHPIRRPRIGTVVGVEMGALFVRYDSSLEVGTYSHSDGHILCHSNEVVTIGEWWLEPEVKQ